MSKITIVGGDILEYIGGKDLSFAKEEIINSGLQVIQNGKENGVNYGINKEAPIIGDIIVDFYVDVFRTKTQIPDSFGVKDTEYKGTFGFDRYNENTSGKGKQSIKDFEILSYNSTKYFVPWLCLWPPKKDIQNITEIEKDYSPVNSAKIVLKIFPGKSQEGKAKLFISANHPNIKIDDNEILEKESSINQQLEITVSCEGILEKDVDVEIRQNDKYGIVVGKLKIVKNNLIYIANTKFITVMEEESETNNSGILQRRASEKVQFENLIKMALIYLNKNSMNQSLIYVKGTVEEPFVIEKGKIKRDSGISAGKYSSSITSPYFGGRSTVETKEEKELDKAIKDLYSAIDRNYKKNRKNTYFCEDTINQTDPQLFKIYDEKYQIFLKSTSIGQQGGREKRKDSLYVFIDKQLETLPVGGMEYYGYTFGAVNSAFIFNKHVKERKFGTFAHEIAHSFGLDHTFELNVQKYEGNRALEKKISDKEAQLKEKDTKQVSSVKENIIDTQTKFQTNLKSLYWNDFNPKADTIETYFDGNKGLYYENINIYINKLKGAAKNEKKEREEITMNINNVNVIESINNEIKSLKQNKIDNLLKFIDVNISETQENFMDYDYDSSGVTNSNFEHKSFWKWQWDNLHKSDFLIKKHLI